MNTASVKPEFPVDMDCTVAMEKLHLEDHDGSFPVGVTSPGPSGEGNVTSQFNVAKAEPSDSMVEVRKTETMGCSLFATQKIPRGTRIVSEEPLAELPDPVYRSELIERFCAMALQLPNEKIVTFSRLYCNKTVLEKTDRDVILEWYNKNSVTDANGEELKGRKRQEHRKKMLKWFGIFLTNSSGHIMNSQKGRGVFTVFSRINHSCVPNARYGWNDTIKRLTVHVGRDIEKDEQIFVSYLPLAYERRAERVKSLKETWGFECACKACLNPDTDVGRVQMGIMRDLVTSYENGDDRFPRLMNLVPIQTREEALEMTSQMAKLMVSEGLVTMDLATLYRSCSRYCAWLGDLDKAIEYAEKALDIERCLIGPETKHLMENLEGCQYWLAHLQTLKATGNAQTDD
ncbi:hypothetical protein PG985_012811 [Apiospora marii]|uniref:SET domain-containing protein n=1 Tax=Apiospora marii TaxID=335849 RepID=A0ABR1RDB5_9PEZI